MSSLPLGLNRIKIERSLTTFGSGGVRSIRHPGIVHGRRVHVLRPERLSNNMILLDRKQSRCPNGLVFGTPGSGKSMSCKRRLPSSS